MISLLRQRAILSLTTIPSLIQWKYVALVTLLSTGGAGGVASYTGFVDPVHDWDPQTLVWHKPWRLVTTFIFPSFVEELFWRGMLLPHPSGIIPSTKRLSTSHHQPILVTSGFVPMAMVVLICHVASHPIMARYLNLWPRGRDVFQDRRFLICATIVLAGATLSYRLSGGSVLAATLTHGIPVLLWRDCFGGERKLQMREDQKVK